LAKILRTAAADEDLLLIAEYGAGRWGVDAAISFVRTFEDAFDLLEQHPDAGRSRGELGEGIRSWLHRGYVV
jgi:plasmid stabilization system protein ParE